jgi:cytidylate kinase
LAWPRPGNRNIKGEIAGVAEMPPQPAKVKQMTAASNTDLTMEPTLMAFIIYDYSKLAIFILARETLTRLQDRISRCIA